MKIALVHDDFTQRGGAESLFATIAQIYPKAPIYTSLVNWEKLPKSIEKERIKASFLQKIPFGSKFYKVLLPFYPLAFESLDLKKYDLVLSSTTRFSKSVITPPSTRHICYINSVPRFLWSGEAVRNYHSELTRALLKPLFAWLKRWDKAASSRVDHYIANSENVRKKVKKIYNQEAVVLYPFADIDYFRKAKIHNWELKSKKYYLVVSRLVKWKKIDLAIRVAGHLNKNLIIVGEGPDKKRLQKIAQKHKGIEFMGRVSRKRLKELYQNAQALIMTQQEDFGISAVEAQACALPVIAYQKGGQAEIIIDKKTGILYQKQTKESLQDAIIAQSKVKWSLSAIRKNSLRFSRSLFVKKLEKQVKEYAGRTPRP